MNRKAFTFVDILVAIGILSILGMSMIKMSSMYLSTALSVPAMDAVYREVSNFSNVFSRGNQINKAVEGNKRDAYICGESSEQSAFLESSLSISQVGEMIEFSLEVKSSFPSSGVKSVEYSRASTVRRLK